MSQLVEESDKALDNYFKITSTKGIINNEEVFRLVFLLYLNELLSDSSILLEEEDINLISNWKQQLYKCSCIIPYPVMINDTFIKGESSFEGRKSEDCILRCSEDTLLREAL